MSVDIRLTPAEIADYARHRHLDLVELSSVGPEARFLDGLMACEVGLDCAIRGLVDLARTYFEMAVPMLLAKLAAEEDVEFHIRLGSVLTEAAPQDKSALRAPNIATAGGSAVIPFDGMTRSEWWTCVGLCHWFLQHRHDSECFKQASNELHRYFVSHPNELDQTESMDDQGRTFTAAEDDPRLVDYFTRHGTRFKPPASMRNIRKERHMGWVLARHRLLGEWSDSRTPRGLGAFPVARRPGLVSAWRNRLFSCLGEGTVLGFGRAQARPIRRVPAGF